MAGRCFGPVWTRDITSSGFVRIRNHASRHRAGVLSITTDYVRGFIRSMDVWRNFILHRARSIFLFCVWKAQADEYAPSRRGGPLGPLNRAKLDLIARRSSCQPEYQRK